MKTLKNQTGYQCEYCNKRLWSKGGAKLHEQEYCRHVGSPHQKNIAKKKRECAHKNTETQYSYIPGEAVMEPNHELCIDCNSVV